MLLPFETTFTSFKKNMWLNSSVIVILIFLQLSILDCLPHICKGFYSLYKFLFDWYINLRGFSFYYLFNDNLFYFHSSVFMFLIWLIKMKYVSQWTRYIKREWCLLFFCKYFSGHAVRITVPNFISMYILNFNNFIPLWYDRLYWMMYWNFSKVHYTILQKRKYVIWCESQ